MNMLLRIELSELVRNHASLCNTMLSSVVSIDFYCFS
uniref:Uncharacterized protein n=1 Tax=Rhizophora mucronata TaxID=61149 RepID=A0A2P2PR07_RHIMU